MTDIFATEQPVVTQPQVVENTTTSSNPYDTLLAEIKNEAGQPKYQSVEVALQSLKASQEYIPQLKQKESALEAELAQLKAELEKRKTVEETVERLAAQQQPVVKETPSISGLDENAVLGILAKRDALNVANANINKVQETLVGKYGDKAIEVLNQKSIELGISVQAIKDIAATSPAAALALFGQAATTKMVSPVSSSFSVPMQKKEDALQRPVKSLLSGASTADQIAFMRQIKAKIMADNGFTEQ
ncbi:MAG: hypothetical protein ACRCVU_14075 [Flavobacterium sp.]